MIEVKPEDLIECDGFEVYDAETGVDLLPSEVAEKTYPAEKSYAILAENFLLSWDGTLYIGLGNGMRVPVPCNGEYLIQINGGKYMRW